MDIDDARDIVEVIANSGDVRIMEYDYASSDFIAKKKVDKVMIKEAYMFRTSEVERMKAAMDKELDEDYAKVMNEYKENRKIELDVTQEVLKEIYERQKKMRGFVEIKDIFYKSTPLPMVTWTRQWRSLRKHTTFPRNWRHLSILTRRN